VSESAKLLGCQENELDILNVIRLKKLVFTLQMYNTRGSYMLYTNVHDESTVMENKTRRIYV
jgi:hypothetical protein